MATNVHLSEDGPERFWGYHNEPRADKFQFLQKVKYCKDAGFNGAYRIYGQLLPEKDFKLAVAQELKKTTKYNHVLYAIHGFNNDPKWSYDQSLTFRKKYDSDKNGGYLVIPINWRNHWGKFGTYYEVRKLKKKQTDRFHFRRALKTISQTDRNDFAPIGGKTLAKSFDVFKSTYKTSVVVHCKFELWCRCVFTFAHDFTRDLILLVVLFFQLIFI